MRAIILAAGAGTRLNPLTNGCPKCLVTAGQRALVDHQLAALEAVGIQDVVLVVGYEAEQIRRHCGSRARYITNPDYASTNSIYSLHLAAAEMGAQTFLFNCDILFDAEILQRMLDPRMPNVVAVDSRVQRVAGEMNVAYDEQGRVSAISKQVPLSRARAQSVQLARFDAQGSSLVRDEVGRLVGQQRRDVFPTSAYGPLIAAGRLFAVEAGDLPWGEIDSLEDYQRVVQDVLPHLRPG
ncbi:MAG: phosphocholine cytidylyltransferase family protein [Candidatus Latescibacterota bacterium]